MFEQRAGLRTRVIEEIMQYLHFFPPVSAAVQANYLVEKWKDKESKIAKTNKQH